MLTKKRGYFFALDAVLALFVLIIGVFLVASSYIEVPQSAQVSLLSDDLMNFLSETKIKNLNNAFAGIGGTLWLNGTITDADNSLLQQIGEFYAAKNFDTAATFVQNVSENIIPKQFLYEVWVNNTIIYPKEPSAEHNRSKNSTALLLTSKKIAFGLINKTTSNVWGPYKSEVFVWER